MTNFECIISADLVRRALFATSSDEGRYYLQGVQVSPSPEGGACITATNGSFLITLHDPEALVSGEGIVHLNKPMKAALKVSGILLEQRLLAVRCNEGAPQKAFVVDVRAKGADDTYSPREEARAVLDAPDARVVSAQFGAVLIDGTYPSWRKVIPTEVAAGAPLPVIDQKLLAKAAEALSEDRKLWRLRLTCTGSDPSVSPVLVRAVGARGVDGFAIVMPTRDAGDPVTVPSWAKPAPAPEAMAAE